MLGAKAGAISGSKEDQEVYCSLFSRGIGLIERLELSAAKRILKMICCPLNIQNADPSPVRMLLKRIKNMMLTKGFQQMASRRLQPIPCC